MPSQKCKQIFSGGWQSGKRIKRKEQLQLMLQLLFLFIWFLWASHYDGMYAHKV